MTVRKEAMNMKRLQNGSMLCSLENLLRVLVLDVKKGTLLFIEGRLQTTKYTGKDGTEKRKVEVVGKTVKFLGNDEYVAPASIPKNVPDTKTQADEGDDDNPDLPSDNVNNIKELPNEHKI